MSEPEKGISLTDLSISDESVRLYLESRYPKEMSEQPPVVIHSPDPSVYDEVRKRQLSALVQPEQVGSTKTVRGYRWRRRSKRRK